MKELTEKETRLLDIYERMSNDEQQRFHRLLVKLRNHSPKAERLYKQCAQGKITFASLLRLV